MGDSCGCGNGYSEESCEIKLTERAFGKNPDSYKTGQLIEKFWELGFDVVFHGPVGEHPNGYITLESLLDDADSVALISDTVTISYSELNDILEGVLDTVMKSVEEHLTKLVLEGDANE